MSADETVGVARTTTKETFADIDSALQAGMRDARECVSLLRLEQALLDFMTADPSVGWMEVGGPGNSLLLFPNKTPPATTNCPLYQSSFHRLLVHRLSDRFGIIREKGLILENSLRLIKLPESKVPETLLRDLDPVEYATTNDTARLNNTPSPALCYNNNTKPSPIPARSDSGGAGGGKPRKVKIMKRQSSHPLKSSSGSSSGGRRDSRRISSSSDLESREKAYAEARARIFSDGSTAEEAKSTSSQNPDADDSLGASGHDGLVQAVASRLSLSESSATSPTTPGTPQAGQSSSSSNSADPTTPDHSRAVYRNRAEEAADPDFRRGAAAVVFQPTNSNHNHNNMFYGTLTPTAAAAATPSYHYAYAGGAPSASPAGVVRGANGLTANAPVFYPGAGGGGGVGVAVTAPYVAYPPNAWQQHHPHARPSPATLQRPSGRANQER